MGLKIAVLLFLLFVLIAPILFDKKVKVEGTTMDDFESFRRRNKKATYNNWRGSKTDERINRMLAESITLMEDPGVPVSRSICPEVFLTGAHSYFGRCCPKGSRKKYNEYDFYI